MSAAGGIAALVVAGGGPAGLAAATLLARSGRAVVLHEAGTYPRHRVCGEFLSPDAAPALAALGCGDLVVRLEAPEIGAVRVTASRGGRRLTEAGFPLEAPGWGVSRFDLDAALAQHARAAGVDVRERSRVDAARSASLAASLGTDLAIVATGRLTRASDGIRAADAARWIGVKCHARGVVLPGVTELHCVGGAYVGLNEVACGGVRVVNVCALVRSDAWERAGRTADGVWDLLAAESPDFAARWRSAVRVEGSDVAVAGFGFRPRGVVTDGGALAIGDAASLTAPLSGAGQAAALASGIDAARCLLDASDPSAEWSRRYRARFRARVRVGGALQRALLAPRAASALLRVVSAAAPTATWIYRRTRGAWHGGDRE